MKPLKTVALLCALALASACTPSKYAVVAPPAEDHQQISLNNEPLITIPKDGDWQWRMTPEDVVKRLVSYAGELGKMYGNCQAELVKYRPAEPKAAPSSAAVKASRTPAARVKTAETK